VRVLLATPGGLVFNIASVYPPNKSFQWTSLRYATELTVRPVMVSVAASPSEKISGSVVSASSQIAFSDAPAFHQSWIRLESEAKVNFLS
jgi:hypothetical protein